MFHVAKPAKTIAMFNIGDLKRGAKQAYENRVAFLGKADRIIADVEEQFENNAEFYGANWDDANQRSVTIKYITYADQSIFTKTVLSAYEKATVKFGRKTVTGTEAFIHISMDH